MTILSVAIAKKVEKLKTFERFCESLYVLNQLPRKIPVRHSPPLLSRWSAWWPVVCAILFEIEQICQPDEEFSTAASDTAGSSFLDKLKPVPTVPLSALLPTAE